MSANLYTGTVTHWRRGVVARSFRYSIRYCWIDLGEFQSDPQLQRLLSGSWRPWAFRPADHGPPSLAEWARAEGPTPAQATARLVDWLWTIASEWRVPRGGAVRCLTQLRNWGYAFSPLNLFYLYDTTDQYLTAVIAEVSNTPWGERHWYVLPIASATTDRSELGDYAPIEHTKEFHVSPFWDMDLNYRWLIVAPADQLQVRIESRRGAAEVFGAELRLHRSTLSRLRLWQQSLTNYRILLGIYYQAYRLWWKKCPTFPHPRPQTPPGTSPTVSGPQLPELTHVG